jgi:hypothetical protein
VEAAQVRKEEAGPRHFRVRCVAQSLRQRVPTGTSTSARCAFAQGQSPVGQKPRVIMREALYSFIRLVASLLARGQRSPQILERVRLA